MAFAEAACVIDNKVDLTDYNTLTIKYYINKKTVSDYIHFFLIVSDSKDDDYTVYNARKELSGSVGNTYIESLDISSLSGEYYIRVHAVGLGSMISEGELYVQQVWLE